MKTGVNVTHLICEAGEVIKDERRSASAWIKKTNKKTSPKQNKRLPTVLTFSRQFSLTFPSPDRLWVMVRPITNGPHNSGEQWCSPG